MNIRVKPGDGRVVLLPPHLGGQPVPADGQEVDGGDLFIIRRIEDGDLVVASAPAAPRATPMGA